MKALTSLIVIGAVVGCGLKQKTSTPAPGTRPIVVAETPAPAPEYPAPTPAPAPAPSAPDAGKPAGDDAKAPAPIPQAPAPAPAPSAPVGPVPVFSNGPALGAVQDCYAVSAAVCALENEVLGAIAGYRAARGLMPLAASYQLGFVARRWSQTMASQGALSPGHPAIFVDGLNVAFGNGVIAGNGINGMIHGVSVAMVPISVAIGDVAAVAILNSLLADTQTATDLIAPYRALGIGLVELNGALYVTVLWVI